eukprot:TRINITY_DN62575_c0_g1_i2.p1 TRINITY_DN62575_c0_g1~~TRINITY_DN62575_c0_g1_i2.p1  ORF type:complete len:753 (-),score=38.34 TRINITY_DN62575_c0_g1_i2:1055-3313(-)
MEVEVPQSDDQPQQPSTLDQLELELDGSVLEAAESAAASPMHSRNNKTYTVGKNSYTVFGKPLVEPRYNPFVNKSVKQARAGDDADKVLAATSQTVPVMTVSRPPNAYGVKLNTSASKKPLSAGQVLTDPSSLYLIDNGSETYIPNVIPNSSSHSATDDESPSMQGRRGNKKQNKSRGVVGKYNHKQRMVEQYRKQLWKKLREHEEIETQAKIRDTNLQSVKELEKEYEMKVLMLAKERDDSRYKAQSLQKEVRDLREQVRVLKDRVLDLQRTDNDVQKKLQAAAEFERTYSLINDHFHYGSPEEAVNNIDTMYHHNATLQSQLLAAQMQLDDLEKAVKAERLEHLEELDEHRVRITDLQVSHETLTVTKNEQTKAVSELTAQLKGLKEADTKLSKLTHAVSEWFYNWKMRIVQFHGSYMEDDSSSTMRVKDDPIAMITVLSGWADQFHPSRAGLLYKELFDIATKAWSALFSSEDQIRGIPKKIFARLLEVATWQEKEMERLKGRVEESKDEAKQAKKDMEEWKREQIRKIEADKRHHHYGYASGHTSDGGEGHPPLHPNPATSRTPSPSEGYHALRSARRHERSERGDTSGADSSDCEHRSARGGYTSASSLSRTPRSDSTPAVPFAPPPPTPTSSAAPTTPHTSRSIPNTSRSALNTPHSSRASYTHRGKHSPGRRAKHSARGSKEEVPQTARSARGKVPRPSSAPLIRADEDGNVSVVGPAVSAIRQARRMQAQDDVVEGVMLPRSAT